jgi:hypothetical protein
VPQGSPSDSHLQPAEALFQPLLGRCGELLVVEEPESEGCIDRHAVPRAAEQFPNRQVQCLAFDVPKGQIDSADLVTVAIDLPASTSSSFLSTYRPPLDIFMNSESGSGAIHVVCATKAARLWH